MDKTGIKNTILENANIGIWLIEIDEGSQPRMYVDDCMKNLLGITEGLSPEETYSFWYSKIHPDYYDAVNKGVEKIVSGVQAEVVYPWLHPVKGMVYVRCGGVRDTSYTKGMRLQGSHQDVTKVYAFHKDTLTGLYTKEFFFERVEEILAENPDTEYRIMVSDIENFKMINEKYGTETGDRLLQYLAEAEKRIVADNYIIGARINADKLACLQYGKKQSRDEGLRMEEEIRKNAPVPNYVWKHGIYYTEFDRTISAQAMCDRAFQAVNSIKGNYSVNCAVYDDKLRHDLLLQQLIEESMEDALEQKQFSVYLQPKHNLHTDKTGGAEALIRWIHPSAGFMNPGVFIPLFEKNGFIQKLDRYVLNHVCEILRGWMDEGKPVVPISVNFSRRDFEFSDLDRQIIDIVDSYRIPHELVHIEITESIFSDDPEQTTLVIQSLHDSGFIIELDDFGTGYTSLKTLNDLALDVLKLDMSLIQNDKPGQKNNILDFCAQLMKMMNLTSVAEGVETEEQLMRMQKLGCDYIQGYFYSKPIPVDEFEEYLRNHF